MPPRPTAGPVTARLASVSPDEPEALALGQSEPEGVDPGSLSLSVDAMPETLPEVVPTSTSVTEASSDKDLERVRNVAVYLPVDLLDRLKRTRHSRELTYADLLVEAAAAHLEGLEALFVSTGPSSGPSGMPARSRPRRRVVEPGVQVQIRLDGHQLLWLDEQVQRLRAPSRTALVVALLQAHVG